MMAVSAIFGVEIDQSILDFLDSYNVQNVRYFKTEAEALNWLRNQ
jgi:hypothetical protein